MSNLKILSTQEFKAAIEATEKIVLVDFYADWCMPCKMIAPILDEVATERDDVEVYKVNIDESPDLAVEFSVKTIPNLISFKKGEVYKRTLGVQPKEAILALVD